MMILLRRGRSDESLPPYIIVIIFYPLKGGGRTPGRGRADRVHGGDDRGRSQGGNRRSQGGPDGDRRDLEQVEIQKAVVERVSRGAARRQRWRSQKLEGGWAFLSL